MSTHKPSPSHPTRDFYTFGSPLYAVHFNGMVYAAFSGPNQALAYWSGLSARSKEFFHIENDKGETVELRDNPHHPGHASAILASLTERNA